MAVSKVYKAITVSLENADTNEDLLDNVTINFNSCDIIYEPSLIPRCNLTISTKEAFPKSYYDLKNIILTIMHGNETYKFSIGIDKMYTTEAHILNIKGLLCKYEDFHDVYSAYLGSSLEDAVNSLKIRETVVGLDSVSQDYWQIQENKLQALIRLLNQSSSNSIFTLSNDSIVVKKITDTQNPKEEIMWTDIEFYSRNRAIFR